MRAVTVHLYEYCELNVGAQERAREEVFDAFLKDTNEMENVRTAQKRYIFNDIPLEEYLFVLQIRKESLVETIESLIVVHKCSFSEDGRWQKVKATFDD